VAPQSALRTAAVLFASFCGALLGISHLHGRSSVFDRLEAPLLDLRFLVAGPRAAPDALAIVAIDDDTVKQAGSYPLPRAVVAQLVEALTAAGAKAVALDLLFLDAGPPQADEELARALRNGRAVIAAAALFDRDGPPPEVRVAPGGVSVPLPAAERVLWPVSPLAEAAAVGLVNIATDHAGTPRHAPLLVRSGDRLLPAFVLRTAASALAADPEFGTDTVSIGSVKTGLDLGYNLPIRFYGPRGTVRTLSAARIVNGSAAADVRDRIVIVGATAIGTADTFATPYDPVLPGVEVLATAIGHLIAGDGLVRTTATRRLDALATTLLPVLTVLLLSIHRIGLGTTLAALAVALWIALTIWAFAHLYWLSIAMPLAATSLPVLLYGAGRLWIDQRAELRSADAQQALRRFHDPALAERITNTPDFLTEPVQQLAAVLFVDLSGFTGLSERLGPQRTRGFLKEFHSLVEADVARFSGIVLSFMGDGAMVVFGLPSPAPEDANHAVASAVSLVDRVSRWLATLPADMMPGLGVRVGAHCGPVVMSRLGSDTHQHITATGDTVNVASRLLEVAADNHATLALSSDLVKAALNEPDARPLPPLGAERQIQIRGRAKPLSVHLWGESAPEDYPPAPSASGRITS
jgi:adenylate cyclase